MYSHTTRRFRGSAISKTQKLQQRLNDAERLLETAGLLTQIRALPSPLNVRDQAQSGVLPSYSASQRIQSSGTTNNGTHGNTHHLAQESPQRVDLVDGGRLSDILETAGPFYPPCGPLDAYDFATSITRGGPITTRPLPAQTRSACIPPEDFHPSNEEICSDVGEPVCRHLSRPCLKANKT